MASTFAHRPVLLEETLEQLALRPGAVIVDGTVGGGGHSAAILEATGPNGQLVGLDVDDDALSAARERLAGFHDRVQLIHSSFRRLSDVLKELGLSHVDGILLDLGVSSWQLDASSRGFRFSGEDSDTTPLDMRMDRSRGESAADLLARGTTDELAGWFREFGQLPGSGRLARTIVETRRERPFRTSRDLLDAIASARVGGGRKHHPATLVYQALRIVVNDEMNALEEGLEAAIEALRPGGRLVVLAYHSIEDRIVKNRLRDAVRGCTCPPGLPACVCGGRIRLRLITRKPVSAGQEERNANPRARSVRLRAAERIAVAA